MRIFPLTDVKWRIAAIFVTLSSVLYIVLSAIGICAFYLSLNYSIDRQLIVQASELGHAIELDIHNTPYFRNWLRVVQTEPPRSLAAIQLFSPQGTLLEHYGLVGPSILIKNTNEAQHFRILISPLKKGTCLLGFLQLALPTAYRDDTIYKLEITIVLLAPVLLLGLGLTSYVVSDIATNPIRENLKLLKQFIADASHELNTPISILQARTDVLEKKLKQANLNTDDLQIISTVAERMEKIIDDLMFLAEIEGELIPISTEPSRLDEILKNVVTEFQTKFDDKGISLCFSQCQPLTIKASEESLHKIISNLVENAWRYTEPGGQVTLSATKDSSFAKLEVQDTGIGISDTCLPLVFDRFYRVDRSRSRASGGSGLGLAIVKALVESYKGYINVHSKMNEGSVFTVCLPFEP